MVAVQLMLGGSLRAALLDPGRHEEMRWGARWGGGCAALRWVLRGAAGCGAAPPRPAAEGSGA